MDYTTNNNNRLNPNPPTDPYPPVYNAQQPSSYTYYPYYSHHSQNPNHSLDDPQLVQNHHGNPSARCEYGPDAGLRPPGIDSYAAMNSFSHAHVGVVGYEGQAVAPPYGYHQAQMGSLAPPAVYYEDPGVATTQNWSANPVAYAAAINSPNKQSIGPTSSTPVFWNNNGMNLPLAHAAKKRAPKKTKVMGSVWCEVCQILCNSKDSFDRHNLGKKHKTNLEKQEVSRTNPNRPTTTTMDKNPMATKKKILQDKMIKPINGQMVMDASTLAIGEEMETKKRKILEGGAAVDSVKVCMICNVVCNSELVFNYHLAGKRHIAQAGLGPPYGAQQVASVTPNPASWTNPRIRPPVNGAWNSAPKKTKVVQSARCEICKIDCDTTDVLDKHKLGKKHKKNLEKLEESKKDDNASAPAPAPVAENPIIGPIENPAVAVQQTSKKSAPSSAPREDLETKKRKVLEGGAATDAVRTCTICNVVCNSQTVFNYHLSGQKHAAMVKKQTVTVA